MQTDELLSAAGGDREEALRLLFTLAKRAAADPDNVPASGPELARMLLTLLRGEPPHPSATWRSAQRITTVAGTSSPDAPTAATVVEAIDQLLNGEALELPPPEDRYDEGDLLGVGGMGRVSRVFDRRLQRSVALKALHHGVMGLAAARRFALEAELTAQLDHPNIVPLYDFARGANGGLYFTMKEVRGRCLSDVIDDARYEVERGEDDGLLLVRLVGMFRQVCDGVAFAHDQGIAHRDLKPDNVMVGDFGEVQVVDWGLAQRFGTETTSTAGTPAYMAPEVARSERVTVGPSHDIYALGATLYQILALCPPYAGPRDLVLERAREGPPAPPDEVAPYAIPEELQAIVLRAMAMTPEDRYPDVGALIEDVQAWLDGRPLASLSYGLGALLSKWMRRNRRLLSAIGLTAAAAAALGAFGLVRYVQDVTEARDRARELRGVAATERDHATAAETVARQRLVEAQLATARAMTETEHFDRAQLLYEAARVELDTLGAPPIGAQVGELDNHDRAVRPMFTIPPPSASTEIVFDPIRGRLLTLTPGSAAVARAPPLFEVAWRSSVLVPQCEAHSARWERGTYALYCATEQEVRRIDLGAGGSSRVTHVVGLPPSVDAPPDTDLLFVGYGDLTYLSQQRPRATWRVLQRAGADWQTLFEVGVHRISSARGAWFIGTRYGDPGAVLYRADRGAVRTLALPMAHAFLSPDGSHVASYDEGDHHLEMETLEGEILWRSEPRRPLALRGFTSDARALFAAAETKLLQLSAEDGAYLRTFDGHDEPVEELLVTDELLLTRGRDGTVLGFSRTAPSDRVAMRVSSLLPPGEVMVAHSGPRELVFIDVATRHALRRVPLPMLADGEPWVAESGQRDGVLLQSPQRLLFVPLAASPVEALATADGRRIGGADRLPDGRVAFCRGSDVVLLDLEGGETVLGSIPGPVCRDVEAMSSDAIFVSDFGHRSVHRFGTGEAGPLWSRSVAAEPYRLSVGSGRVSVGDWTGRLYVFDADSGEVTLEEQITDGPMLGSAMTADAPYVAVAGWDTRMCVVDVETGRLLAEDSRHVQPLEWVAWSEDERRLVTADPAEAVVRDLDRPEELRTAHASLSELAAHPDRDRSGVEWAAVARGLAANGRWSDALAIIGRSDGVSALERARWLWLADRPGAAAEQFARARSEQLADDTYLELCAAAARREATGE